MTENNSIPEEGIFIPEKVFNLENTTYTEKAFLGLIYSLGNKCQLSNKALGELMNTTQKNAANYVYSLKKSGYLTVSKNYNTNTRILSVLL